MALKQKLQEAAVAVEDCRRKLAQAEQHYDALFKQATSGGKPKKLAPIQDTPVAADTQNGHASLTFTQRIRAVLMSEAEKEWTNGEIQKVLPDVPKTTLPSLLHRLRKTSKVVKTGYGKWKTSEI